MTIIFAFVGNETDYYINNGSKSRWDHAPADLATGLRRVGLAGVRGVYGGLHGKYVLRATDGIHIKGLASGLQAKDLKLYASGGNGSWWCQYVGGRTVWGDLHTTLSKKLGEVGGANVKTMSLGKEANSWAITFTRNGTHCIAWNNVPASLVELLRSRSDAVDIVLSPWNHEHYFVLFRDGSYRYILPKAWLNAEHKML